jgi:hypothetical protein
MGFVFFFTGIMIFFDQFLKLHALLAASNSATVILYCFAMEYFVSCGKISRTTTSDVGSFVSLDFSKSSLLLFELFFSGQYFFEFLLLVPQNTAKF